MKLLLAAALLLPAAAAAQMYKCVDDKGVTHYTDAPQPGCTGAQVDIRPIPSLSGSAPARPEEDFAREDADFKRRQNERAQAQAQERAALQQRCRSLRRERTLLSGGGRLSRLDDKGERVYLPDEARAQRLAQVYEALRACP